MQKKRKINLIGIEVKRNKIHWKTLFEIVLNTFRVVIGIQPREMTVIFVYTNI